MKLRTLLLTVLLSPLMLLLACPLAHAYSTYFYVIPSSAPLRECASPNCDVLLTVYRGDKVEILERTSGWSRVRLVDKTGAGWILSDLLSYSPDLQVKAPPTYHVNTSSTPLLQHPDPDSTVLTTLHYNDPVEMLGVTAGYAQVRDLRTSYVGWVLPRHLSSGDASPPRSRHRRPAHKAPPKEKPPEPPSAM
jgi:uncharacterized protein YgiM (DUF1202 family)